MPAACTASCAACRRPPACAVSSRHAHLAAGSPLLSASHVGRRLLRCRPAAASQQAAAPGTAPGTAPAPSPPARRPLFTSGEEAELQHLCLEVAAAATLSPEEEKALVEAEKQQLDEAADLHPPDVASLPQPLLVLRCRPEGWGDDEGQETTFYILGTAHISRQSCEDVAALIRAVRPQFVFLELDKERGAMLAPTGEMREATVAEMAALVRAGKATPFSVVYAWLLAKVGRKLDAPAGEEFRVALREAKALGAKYVLGDRPISVTMARMWHALTGWEKARLMGSMLWVGASKVDSKAMAAEIEQLKDTDALSAAVAEFAKDYPNVVGPLMTERDLYMTAVLRKLALYGTRVVAVVGAGHLPGIKAHWEDEIDLQELLSLPK